MLGEHAAFLFQRCPQCILKFDPALDLTLHFGGAQRHLLLQPMAVLARHVGRQIGLLALHVAALALIASHDEQAEQQHMQHRAQRRDAASVVNPTISAKASN
ncbi:hypothetical protein G6F22_018864 [Rhizopus arrhizus]|nr:hypothetical protein G6F22_018864 [Rhizopus arrhizus]